MSQDNLGLGDVLELEKHFSRWKHMSFIDFEKPFDCAPQTRLITALQSIQRDDKDVKIIAKLCWNQTATINANNIESKLISIELGVRQGCSLFLTLFSEYSEYIFRKALKDQTGIGIGEETINNIQYCDSG